MKSKGYFLGRNASENKPGKRIKIIALLLAIVLIPALIVGIRYVMESGQVTAPEQNQLQISLYYENHLYVEEKGNPQLAKSGSLVSIFSSLRSNLKEVKELPEDVNPDHMILAVYSDNDVRSEYRCYFSFNQNYSFCLDSNNKAYAISESDVEVFLDSTYSQPLFKAATPPAMLTTANDTVIPQEVSWKYRNDSGAWLDADGIPTEEELISYNMAGQIGIRFDTAPDNCSVTVFKGGLILHEELPLSALPTITVEPGTILRFKVYAQWLEREDRSFCGELRYDFEALIRDRSEFLLEKTELTAGEITLISCTNIIDTDRIQFRCEPDIGFQPVFFEDDDLVRALIPFSASLAPGNYEITLTYGVTEQKLSLTLKSRPDSASVTLTPPANLHLLLSPAATDAHRSLLHTLAQKKINTRYFRGAFLDYSEIASPKLDFGTNAFFHGTEYAYTSEGIEYTPKSASGGASVPTANAGTVIFAGYTEHLGNTVVVEHGLGLRTWYAHLSEIDVHEGDALTKGQSVGKTGTIGFCGEENFFLMATVFDIPVDYSLIAGYVPQLPEVPKDPSKDQSGFLD